MGALIGANWLAIVLACGIAGLVIYIVKQRKAAPAPATDTTAPANLKASITAKADALKGDIGAILTGLGMDVKNIEGDFGAATALFLNRALSHGVAKLVQPGDKAAVEKLYADAAQFIAASGTTTTAA